MDKHDINIIRQFTALSSLFSSGKYLPGKAGGIKFRYTWAMLTGRKERENGGFYGKQ